MFKGAIDGFIDFIFGTNIFAGIASILTKSPTDYVTAWEYVEIVYNKIFLPLGYAVMLIFFLTALMNKISMEQFTLEHFIFIFIRLFIVKIALDNGLNIMETLMKVGNNLILSVSGNSLVEGINVTSQIKSNLTYGNMFDQLGLLITLVIPWLGMFISKIFIQVVCYSRLLEIMIRTVIAPVALGDIFTEGTNGTGFRFLKAYFAVCLQGIIMFGICFMFSTISADIIGGISNFSDIMGFAVIELIMSFACISLVMKSLSLAKEVMGVG